MSKLDLSIAVGPYDRMRPLMDGDVTIDGVNPVFMRLAPEEIFFRALRHQEFDVCELSLSSFSVKTARGDNPYVGIPVFPSRAFRHTAIYIRNDKGIKRPEDLKGRRIGVPEYQLTANVWARAILSDDHRVKPSDIVWVRGGLFETGRVEKVELNLPKDVRLEDAPHDKTISAMLGDGEIDGIIAPRAPLGFGEHPKIGWLFADPIAAATEYYKRTKIFPIMHVLGLRRTLAQSHPWLPAALLKAFTKSKDLALDLLTDESAPKASLAFVDVSIARARALMGHDYWSYGLAANRHVLETFLGHHHAEGLSARRLKPEELFHPATLENFTI
jgi:4,5-dihydroxyphthalate decarboxylase